MWHQGPEMNCSLYVITKQVQGPKTVEKVGNCNFVSVPKFKRSDSGQAGQVKGDRTTHGSTLVSRVNSGFGLSPGQMQSTRTTFVQLQSTKVNGQTAGQQQSKRDPVKI
ncbi:hypothetical protein HanRHA438_Chr12g0544951 [Helianthus annuus]|nr:hypothetical protein HanRHA438_Chr12g0544951 [Helianthus annuus]